MSEIMFASVKDAVRWSEEVSTLVDIGSCLGDLLRKPSNGTLSRSDMIDIARTISLITASCKPYKGQAMRAIYVGHDQMRDKGLALAITSIITGCDSAAGCSHNQLFALGLATIKAVRARELYGHRFPLKRMAYDIGVSREHFSRSNKWRALRDAAELVVLTWLSEAVNEIWLELNDRGWVA